MERNRKLQRFFFSSKFIKNSNLCVAWIWRRNSHCDRVWHLLMELSRFYERGCTQYCSMFRRITDGAPLIQIFSIRDTLYEKQIMKLLQTSIRMLICHDWLSRFSIILICDEYSPRFSLFIPPVGEPEPRLAVRPLSRDWKPTNHGGPHDRNWRHISPENAALHWKPSDQP